jgi:hypothetical protein
MVKEFETLNLDSISKARLEHISKITNIAQSRILAEIIECIFALAVNYDKATFSCIDKVTENTVYISMIGLRSKSALTFGAFKSSESNAEVDKIIDKQVLERINADLEKK